ncbi:LegC family aminotransferase [Vicingaceae bacterium]|nr:LegC family aminotransferase [Vicingaceae bacterium]
MFNEIIEFVKAQFPGKKFIPLHEPKFIGNEKKYLNDCIDSTFVSSAGEYVTRFEKMMCELTGAKHAVAIVNGTNALHIGLLVSGVKPQEEVITQALTFVATGNAISYCDAIPIFIDVDKSTLGMSPEALIEFLEQNAFVATDGYAYNKNSNKRVAACVPMHTFGFPCDIARLAEICKKWNIALVEDAAESLGSYYKGKHTGTFGKLGVFSFNGNKTITCGGGGALVTNDEEIAKRVKHLTTQAKVQHKWEFNHDQIGYNYRMPNLNAALACAQLEQLRNFVENKRQLAQKYQDFFEGRSITHIKESNNAKSNYWLNAVLLKNKEERNQFLEATNANGVMTRPVWELLNRLSMFEDCQTDGLENSKWLSDRLVNIPSSVRV